MPERGFQIVCPPYSLEFSSPDGSQNSDNNVPDGTLIHTVPFTDILTGEEKVAILNSPDTKLIKDINELVNFSRPVTEDVVRNEISKYSTRNPSARLSYTGEKGVQCEEPSCSFHFEGGCVNTEVLINDDCIEDSFCLTYEAKEQEIK